LGEGGEREGGWGGVGERGREGERERGREGEREGGRKEEGERERDISESPGALVCTVCTECAHSKCAQIFFGLFRSVHT
jgi:hypothetical protein